jgi:uncharacterized protein YqgC (DUF456 family)
MNKVIAIILIVLALAVGYIGINKIAASSDSVKFLGIEFSSTDESAQTEGVLYVGFAVILLFGGIFVLRKDK